MKSNRFRNSAVRTLTDNLHHALRWHVCSPILKKQNANKKRNKLNPRTSSVATVKRQMVKQLKVRRVDWKLLIWQLF